jgi:hypothetical protein
MNNADLDVLLQLLLGLLAVIAIHVIAAALTVKYITGRWPFQSASATDMFRRYFP